MLITERQRKLLKKATTYLITSKKLLISGASIDIVASTLHDFSLSIQELIGEIPNQDVYNNIFSSFCIGK